MATDPEPTTVALSVSTHGKLKRLKEEGHFADMADAYRFAIALALAHGVTPGDITGARQTVFNIGTLDPDKSVYAAVSALRPDSSEPVYRTAEKLAEWGLEELSNMAQDGEIPFADLFKDAESLREVTSK